MSGELSPSDRRQLISIGIVTILISVLFVGMIRNFLITLFFAAVLSIMAAPIYRWIAARLGGRTGIAAGLTLLVLIAGVFIPAAVLIYFAAAQANSLAGDLLDFAKSGNLEAFAGTLPDWLVPDGMGEDPGSAIAGKVSEYAGRIAEFFVNQVSGIIRGTASFFLGLIVLLYAMYFFIQSDESTLRQVLHYSGLRPEMQSRLAERMVSISRATLKGTLVIGIVQGTLGGLAFWAAGLKGAAFWGIIMLVASVIPGIGPGLILVPAAIYLALTGDMLTAAALLLWTFLVVGTVDNILRPLLVGRDTKLSELIILVSTLGGLTMFGAVGLVLGPVIAGLFVSIWQEFRLAIEPPGDEAAET